MFYASFKQIHEDRFYQGQCTSSKERRFVALHGAFPYAELYHTSIFCVVAEVSCPHTVLSVLQVVGVAFLFVPELHPSCWEVEPTKSPPSSNCGNSAVRSSGRHIAKHRQQLACIRHYSLTSASFRRNLKEDILNGPV